MEQIHKHKRAKFRRLAIYLRAAAGRNSTLAFAARMVGVADELDQEASALESATANALPASAQIFANTNSETDASLTIEF